MKIVIVGAGGVGGYFGGKIAEAGYDTTFLARGKHLQAIRDKGLQIKSFKGDFKVIPKATDNIECILDADLIILCIKSWQLDNLAKDLNKLLKPSAIVLPLQNGADNAERLSRILDPKYVVAGLCRIVSKIESPGVINHFGYEPEIVFGELNNRISTRLSIMQDVFNRAGFKNKASHQIQRDIWLKFLFITTISGMGALTRSVLGVIREDQYLRCKLEETAQEIVRIARAMHIEITEQDIEKTFEVIDRQKFETTMSMQRDIMQGLPSELENFNGFIVHKGLELGISTPVNSFVYRSLLPMELLARDSKGIR